MYYKDLYMNENQWKILLQKMIFNEKLDIVTIIHKSDDPKYLYKINLTSNDKLSKYIPSVNCSQNNWELDEWILEDYNGFSFRIWNERLLKGAIIIKNLKSEFGVYSMISPVMWYTSGMKLEEENEEKKSKWSDKKCWCRPNSIIYTNFKNERIISDYKTINSLKTIKWVKIYDEIPTFCKEDITKVFFPFLSVNKGWSTKLVNIKFKTSEETATKFEILSKSLIFITQKWIVPIKFDPIVFNVNGLLKSIENINQTEYALINWFDLEMINMNVQYDENSELIKQLKIKDISDITNNNNHIFILVKLRDIKIIEWYSPSSLRILSISKFRYNIKIFQNCKRYDIFDLAQNIKQIPRNLKLWITDYFLIDHWFLDKSFNEFWKVILEFKNVYFKCKSNTDIAINGTTNEFDYDNLRKNIFKINYNGHDEIASFNVLLILIWN